MQTASVKQKKLGVKKKYRKEERLYSPKVKKTDVKQKRGGTKKKRSIQPERSRDQLGRFAPETREESQFELDRKVKLVKTKGTYNSYLLKERLLSEQDVDILIVLGLLGVLAIIF